MSAAYLFEQVGLTVTESVRWGTVPKSAEAGVYAISLSADPSAHDAMLDAAPLDPKRITKWLSRVPALTLDGAANPTAHAVASALQQFWMPDENIVYIGKATSLKGRLRQFLGHVLGDRAPHAGGHWLKTLSASTPLHIHAATCATVREAEVAESRLMSEFMKQVSLRSRAHLRDCSLAIPFANREYPKGCRKQNRIANDVRR